MKKLFLAGISAIALAAGVSSAAWADGVNLDTSNSVGAAAGLDNSEVKGIGGGSTFGDSDALAINALSQVSASSLAGGDLQSGIDGNLADQMDFSNHAFQNETASQNNFASGINAAQQGAVAIAGAVSNH